MGLIEFPNRRFLLFSAIGGALWATYTCLLVYWIGGALAGFPIASTCHLRCHHDDPDRRGLLDRSPQARG
jgi:hypothetical protein